MISNGFRHAVMAAEPTELTNNIPEHANLGKEWNERARGLGATLHNPLGISAEENILCHSNDRYREFLMMGRLVDKFIAAASVQSHTYNKFFYTWQVEMDKT